MKRFLYLILSTYLLASCATHTNKLSAEQNVKLANFHYQIGVDALQKGLLAKGFDELMTSNSQVPNQPEVLDALAYAWRLRGDFVKSESFYKQAVTAGGSSPTFTNYGALLVSLKRYPEAEVQLRKALKDPRYPKQYIAQIHLGDALLGQDKLEEAIASYRTAGMLGRNQSLPQIKEAQAYVKSNRLNYAKALYETILRKEPNNRAALEGLIALLEKQGDLQTSQKFISAYIEKSTDPLERAWAADELIRLGRLQ